jgi:hypothetical protein
MSKKYFSTPAEAIQADLATTDADLKVIQSFLKKYRQPGAALDWGDAGDVNQVKIWIKEIAEWIQES